MKIGVIGLGSIAQKAYMPTYRSHQETEFIFATRNAETRQQLAAKWGIPYIYQELDELLQVGIEACIIHSATASHYQLVKRCLEAGVHVYVDKPLSEELAEVDELLALAEARGLLLMVGFNRRYAPFVKELAQLPDKGLMILQKNRVAGIGAPKFMVFDLFLHVVDTAVFLLEEELTDQQGDVTIVDGLLQRCSLQLKTASQTVICSMDLVSGVNFEQVQVDTPQGTYLLRDLDKLTVMTAAGDQQRRFGDWEGTLAKRGFEESIAVFVAAVAAGETQLPSQKNIRLSHALCAGLLEG